MRIVDRTLRYNTRTVFKGCQLIFIYLGFNIGRITTGSFYGQRKPVHTVGQDSIL